MELKIIKFGNSAGVILPRALLAHLHVRIGDTILASETPGCIRLTASNQDFVTKMSTAEVIMHEDRNLLGKLTE